MPDFVDDVFDPAVAPRDLRPERLKALNLAKSRQRALDRLATVPLSAEKVPAALAIVEWLGAHRNADRLRAIFADSSAALVNRAVCATALYGADLDPGVPPARLPEVIEGVLVGSALSDDEPDLNDLVAALLATDLADAVIARIETWRVHLAVPASQVYRSALSNRRCAAAHATILASLEHDPRTVSMVRDALGSGLDPALFRDYLTRPAASRPANGRVFHRANCTGCGGVVIAGRVDLDTSTTLFDMHLAPSGASDAEISPMAALESIAAFEEIYGDLPEIPLAQVVAAARAVHGHDAEDERVLWLLHHLEAADEGIDAWLADPHDLDDIDDIDAPYTDEEIQECIDNLSGSEIQDALVDAAILIEHGIRGGRYARPADDLWHQLLASFLPFLDRVPRWGEPAPAALLAWIDVSIAIGEHDIPAATLSEQQIDRFDWYSALAEVVAADDLDRGAREIAGLVDDLEMCLFRTGKTPRDVSVDLGAPHELAENVAARLGIGVDERMVAEAG